MDPNTNNNSFINPNSPLTSSGKEKKKFALPSFFFPVVIAVILSSGLSVTVTYLIMKDNSGSSIFSNEEIPEESDVNIKSVIGTTGNESKEDVLKQLDEKISSSSSDASENFDDKMTKIAFLFDFEKYDEVKSALDGISLDNLSNYQLFQVYNSYARYYNLVGDSASAEDYKARAKDAEEKYIVE